MIPVLAAVGLLICVAFQCRQKSSADVQNLPGPSTRFASYLWGHELVVFEHSATQMYTLWSRAFGGLFKIKGALFHPDIIVATDHAAVRHIFANSDLYVKSPAFRPPIINLMGAGLVWAEGEDWHRQRKILAPAFSSESVKEMTSAIYEAAERLETRLTNLLLNRTTSNASLNIVRYISACTLDIIGAVGLSHPFAAQSSHPSADASEIHASWSQHVNNGLQWLAFLAPLVVRAVPAVAEAPLPLMQSQGVIKTVVTRLGRGILEREQAVLDATKGAGSQPGQKKDIITMLLRNRQMAKPEDRLSDSQILDNISTFTMVGHETTAGSLCFTLWELARHPEYQERLRAEVLAHPRDMSYEEVQKLEYLDAVVKEGLRLHPASPQTERVVLKDDFLPLSSPICGMSAPGVQIKKGQVIHIPFTSMNTNPAVWGPTGDIFDPSRWLVARDASAPALPHGWNGLLTFCDGPRNCVGWRLAVLEFKIILATLVRTLRFTDTGARVDSRISPTLQPVVDGKGGVLPLGIQLV
ncbi:hypothetical protein MKEN_00538200 [Mycena kentingensis (nom. inval.)]|nr:hypothetical protein MKEN_00538200 [Mycena kentingensis (nom. inval.)]